MKHNKNNVLHNIFYLVFFLLNWGQNVIFCSAIDSDIIVSGGTQYIKLCKDKSNCQGLLLNDPSNPFFIARETANKIATIKWHINCLPSPNDWQSVFKICMVVHKLIGRFTEEDSYFPLFECISLGCPLIRKNPKNSVRYNFVDLIGERLLGIKEEYDILRIISNGTGDFLMDWECIKAYYKKLTNNKRTVGHAQIIELHCIDPFFQYIGTGEHDKPFTKERRAYTAEHIAPIACIMSTCLGDRRSYCLQKLLLMKAIDTFIRLCEKQCNIQARVYTYLSIGDFMQGNNANEYPFQLCYTIDVLKVLKDPARYMQEEYRELYTFLVNRQSKSNSRSKCAMYVLDCFKPDKTEILFREI